MPKFYVCPFFDHNLESVSLLDTKGRPHLFLGLDFLNNLMISIGMSQLTVPEVVLHR